MTDPSGLPPKTFEVVDELVAKFTANELEPEQRRLHNEHPLLVVTESTLEALSGKHLGQPIYSFSRESEERLVIERRRLEVAGQREELQLLLYAFESMGPTVRRTGYAGADFAMSTEYFAELFPSWMAAVETWARAENFLDLHAQVKTSRAAYDPIATALALP